VCGLSQFQAVSSSETLKQIAQLKAKEWLLHGSLNPLSGNTNVFLARSDASVSLR
jgi:hypothetical protein